MIQGINQLLRRCKMIYRFNEPRNFYSNYTRGLTRWFSRLRKSHLVLTYNDGTSFTDSPFKNLIVKLHKNSSSAMSHCHRSDDDSSTKRKNKQTTLISHTTISNSFKSSFFFSFENYNPISNQLFIHISK